LKEVPYEQLGVTKSFGKKFSSYSNKSQHVVGAEFANDRLDCNITEKDKPLMFYIVSHCEDDLKPKDRTKAICLLETDLHYLNENGGLFEVDYDVYFNKQVIEQLQEFDQIESVVKVLKEYKVGEDGPETYEWDEGVAP